MMTNRFMTVGALLLMCIATGCTATAKEDVSTVEYILDRSACRKVHRVRLQDGMVILPHITGTFGDIRILSEHKGLPDVWFGTICEPDPMMLSYYVSAPEGYIGVSSKMVGGMGFGLDHPDDIIQVMCVKRNVVRVFSRFNAGRSMRK